MLQARDPNGVAAMPVTILSSFLLAVSAPQAAAQAPAPDPNPMGSIIVNANRKRWDPQRVVCKELDQPGSRLNVKKVCRTMLEWASDRREDQQLLIQKQFNGAP
jgi:hypothetical protein